MAKRKGFVMYFEWVDMLEELNADEVKQLLLDMNRYVQHGEQPTYHTREMRMAWKMIGARLDADNERYARVAEKNRESANKRWEQEQCRSAEKPPENKGWLNTGFRL